MSEFDRFRALSFDCYGTLIDWEAGLIGQLRPWAEAHQVEVGDEALLQLFAEIEPEVEAEGSPPPLYPQVLKEVLGRIGACLGVEPTAEELASFGGSVGDWPAFPDTADALARLKARYRLIIVSNVDRRSFAGSNRRLGVAFDRIITAEDVGSYKPHTAHFEALLATLPSMGVERHQLLHVAQSLFHDHEPAQRQGLESVWIDRRQDRPGSGATPLPPGAVRPHWRFASLGAFADAVEATP
jgi:putative hydrolase of the HAD superfamily